MRADRESIMNDILIEKVLSTAIERAELEGLVQTSISLRYLKADLEEALQEHKRNVIGKILIFPPIKTSGTTKC